MLRGVYVPLRLPVGPRVAGGCAARVAPAPPRVHLLRIHGQHDARLAVLHSHRREPPAAPCAEPEEHRLGPRATRKAELAGVRGERARACDVRRVGG